MLSKMRISSGIKKWANGAFLGKLFGMASKKDSIPEAIEKYITKKVEKFGLTLDLYDAFGPAYDLREGTKLGKLSRLGIADALKKNQAERIECKGSYSVSDYELDVNYEVEESFNGYINIALIENEADVIIKRGENSGRKITYSNIVRSFQQIDCREVNRGKLKIDLPEDLEGDNITVIIYLQNLMGQH